MIPSTGGFESECGDTSTNAFYQQEEVWVQALQLRLMNTLHHHACLPVSGHPPTRLKALYYHPCFVMMQKNHTRVMQVGTKRNQQHHLPSICVTAATLQQRAYVQVPCGHDPVYIFLGNGCGLSCTQRTSKQMFGCRACTS
jgi:hypothetical protein